MFAVYVAAEVIDQSAGLLCNPHKPFPALLTNFNDRRFVKLFRANSAPFGEFYR